MNAFPQLQMPQVRSAPGRQLITADPRKLSFFAQANGARFGVHRTAGALSGLGTVLDLPPGTGPTGDSVKVGNDIATVAGSFLNSLIGGAKNVPVDTSYADVPPPDTSILGLPRWLVIGGGVAVAGVVGYKLWKKR